MSPREQIKNKIHNYLSDKRQYLRNIRMLQELDKKLFDYLVSKNTTTKVCYGANLYINEDDYAISRRLWREGVFQPDLTKFLLSEIKTGQSIVDIGANIGYFSVLMGMMAGEDGSVNAFEPEPKNHSILNRNINENDLANVINAHQIAISDERSEVKLFKDEYNKGKHSLINQGNRQGSISVQSTPLDHIIEKPVDIVKIDVEGVEDKVISGMSEMIKNHRPLLIIENNPEDWEESSEDVFMPVVNSGLSPHRVDSEGQIHEVGSTELDNLSDIIFKYI